MCIHWRGGNIGCAYYSHPVHELCLMEDLKDQSPFTRASQSQISPRTMIIAFDMEEELIEILHAYDSHVKIHRVPKKGFAYARGKDILLEWRIDEMNKSRLSEETREDERLDRPSDEHQLPARLDDQRQQAYLQLACLIDLNSSTAIGCAGVLFTYLQELDDTGNVSSPNGITSIIGNLRLRMVSRYKE
ncbi:hypothetical protein EC973_009321 [Apophysomyces ossiformis]|uniref:Uncharacterized protein n=1 Tax=Apophysomyces ossiformis TaxID=679940 RepID=A0A8H7BUZ7_9FUNG|nr:hypothetical protein EC973_009321 [Apophysomyces ossiformis]